MTSPHVFKYLTVNREKKGVLVLAVTVASLLDDVSIDLRHDLAALFSEGIPKRVVLDLQRVEAISSSGVGALISLLRRVREAGGKLVLCGLSPYVISTLKLCKLIDDDPRSPTATFAYEADVTAALASLKVK